MRPLFSKLSAGNQPSSYSGEYPAYFPLNWSLVQCSHESMISSSSYWGSASIMIGGCTSHCCKESLSSLRVQEKRCGICCVLSLRSGGLVD